MATLSDDSSSLDVDVLDSSSIGRRRDSVLHFRIGGQPPDVTLRQHTGFAGDIDFSVRDVVTANEIRDMHDTNGVLTLDSALRRNLILHPRATSAARWAAVAGTGGVTTETMVSGAADGPTLPDGTKATTYARYTWTTANTGGTPAAGPADDASALGTYFQGDPVATVMYARCSVPIPNPWNALTVRLPNSSVSTQSSPWGTAIPANTWTLVDRAWVLPAMSGGVASYVTPRLNLNGQIMPLNSTLDVTCALLELADDVGPYFDGNTLPGDGFHYWWTAGTFFSPSIQTIGPPLTFPYVAQSTDVPHYDPQTGRWIVRARGVQEVRP